MRTNHRTITAELRCQCLACLGEEVDSYGRKCIGCNGEGWFYIPAEENCLDDIRDMADGWAWDAVATKVLEAGAEIHDEAFKLELCDEEFEIARDERGEEIYNYARGKFEGRYVLTLRIKPSPISKANAAAMNAALVRK